MRMLLALVRLPPTKTSSPSGRMLTPTFPSSSRPKQSTRSYKSPLRSNWRPETARHWAGSMKKTCLYLQVPTRELKMMMLFEFVIIYLSKTKSQVLPAGIPY